MTNTIDSMVTITGAEYERLRAEASLRDGHDVYAAAREEYRKTIAEQAQEIERLRTDVRHAAMADSDYVKEIDAVNERLRARVAELERALRELLEYEGGAFCVCDDPYVMDRARIALNKAEEVP